MRDMVKVLIVDDSPSMRQLLRAGLAADSRLQVVAEAGDAEQARAAIRDFRPDVMTLDVGMPGVDGLEFLRRLMRVRPMPVVMMSAQTRRGSETAIRAMSLGAVDCFEKPLFGQERRTFRDLADGLIAAASARIARRPDRPSGGPRPVAAQRGWHGAVVLIGASTGGVEALHRVLERFPEKCPPTLITQHMPPHFLTSFAARLNEVCAPRVRLAGNGDIVADGEVLIAPGGDSHMIMPDADRARVQLCAGPKQSGHRPSVDVMFQSAAGYAGRVVATLLTGMGADGATGMQALHRRGAFCIAQDRDSAVVYGMPRVACELGAVDVSLPVNRIGEHILSEAAKRGRCCA